MGQAVILKRDTYIYCQWNVEVDQSKDQIKVLNVWPEINKDWPLAISDRKTITSSLPNENCFMYQFDITWENRVSLSDVLVDQKRL